MHGVRHRYLWPIVSLFLILAACGPGERPILAIRVQDRLTQAALSGAECRLPESAARSDAAGYCRFASWSHGSTLQVVASGYQPATVVLNNLQVAAEAKAVTTTVELLPDRVRGTVLDDYTGRPVFGATVRAPHQAVTTDAEGHFTILTPTFPLSLTVEVPGYEPRQQSFSATSVQIAVRPNTLAGQVTDRSDGRPLAGAVVTVSGSVLLTTTTTADGRYFLAGVPERFTLQVWAPRYRSLEMDLERTTSADVPLRPAFLQGYVRDDAGQPLPQARVICAGTYTHTDDLGHFYFPEVPEVAVVKVLAPGFAREVVTVTEASSITVGLTPFHVQGIYITAYVAGTPDWFGQLLDLVDKSDLNAVVIEVKDAWGFVTYDSQLLQVQEYGTLDVRYDVHEVLRQCRERGIYTIAYIVTFEDSQLPKAKPEWAIQSTAGGLWKNWAGLNWGDPTREEVWEYNIAIARELAELGFDEVQFDYIRFPTDGPTALLRYYDDMSGLTEEERIQKQYDTITAFVRRAYEELAPTGAFISADVFGYAAWRKMFEQGQDISQMTYYLDYFCPMAYPSHYSRGEQGCANPASCPYAIVLETVRRAKLQMAEGQRARIRPWLQDFTLAGDPLYGPKEVEEQIRAAYDGGSVGYCLWNAGNVYTRGVDYSP